MATEKLLTPIYASIKSLGSFYDQRREDGHITTVVDRSLMSNFSGSTANELLSGLKFLKMIDDKNKPLELYEAYVNADEETRKMLMHAMIIESYGFLFADGFDITRATTQQVAEKFRSQGVNGSTLVRAMSFFLAAAKWCGFKVSPNIKLPVVSKAARPRKEPAKPAAAQVDEVEAPPADTTQKPPEGYQIFEIPIPIDRKVRITIPKNFSATDWDLFTTMLTAYVQGWKQQHQDKGPNQTG